MTYPAFDITNNTTVCAVSTTSGTFTLTGAPQSGSYQIYVFNLLTVPVFIRAGAGTTSSADLPLAAGLGLVFTLENTQQVSLVASSGTGNVNISVGCGY